MRRQLRLVLVGLTFSVSCSHRAVPLLPDGGTSLIEYRDPDLGRTSDRAQACRPERRLLRSHADPRGNFSLATAVEASVSPIQIAGAASLESAAAIDQDGVAGLALTRPCTEAAAVELAALHSRLSAQLQSAGLGVLTVRASGALGHSHDGAPEMKGAVWDLTAPAAQETSSLRDRLLAAALDRPLSALSGLPPPLGPSSTGLVLRLALARRGEYLALSAAVLRRSDEEDPASPLPLIAEDLSNGTALAGPGAVPQLHCDLGAVTGQPLADIIWVIDESFSMDDNRRSIVDNANIFFEKALAANLDFRMGVTGVRKPDGYAQLGKFCSCEGPQAHDGGEDRFLLPSEQDRFSACVQNPPYFENSFEYGLTAIHAAIKRHLPRALAPDRIRPGARLAIIVATDELPQELKPDGSFEGKVGFLPQPDWSACNLGSSKQAKVVELLQPIRQLLAASTPPASVHLIAGVCSASSACTESTPEVPHGYRELSEEFGGVSGDICQKNLGPTLQVIIDSIAASASPRALQATPISASLEVELNGRPLPRSHQQGFVYDPLANALTFVKVKVQKGDWVVASYRTFKP